MRKRRDLPTDVAGRDLLRLEKAAKDMGLTPEELMQQASDLVAQRLFVIPTKPGALVHQFAPSNRREPNAD